VAVIEAQQLGAVLFPAADSCHSSAGCTTGISTSGAAAVHLLAHDVSRPCAARATERQPGVDAGGQLADQAGAQHQLVADDFGVGRARFNTRTAADKRFFEGLPSPSAAAIVSAFIWSSSEWREPGLAGLIMAALVTATAGFLMVSSFGYNSFKKLDAEGPVRFATFLLVPLGFILIALYPPTALLAIFGTYALSGPLFWVLKRMRRGQRREPQEPDAT
jgi:hypothetical protein